MTALYLIPAFGVLWGVMFLGEVFTLEMAMGCAVILAGTALTNGLIKFDTRRDGWFSFSRGD